MPAACGSVGVICTVTVGVLLPEPPDPLEEDVLATFPTEDTTPGVVLLSGRVMATVSPFLTWDCRPASRSTLTCRVVELEDMPVDSEESGIDGRIVHYDEPGRLFYISDAGIALVNFELFDKVPEKQKLKKICDEAIENWMLRRDFLDSEEDEEG